MWIWPLYLHVNQKSDDDDDEFCIKPSRQDGSDEGSQHAFLMRNEKIYHQIQSNLSDSNADFSKPLDFSNLTVSPILFRYYLCKNITDFSNFDYSKNSIFRIILSVPIKEIPVKIHLQIGSKNMSNTVMHDHVFF